jgi:hypothetical protein
MGQIKSIEQTSVTTPDHEFLVSLTPEAIQWTSLFAGSRSLWSPETLTIQAPRMSFALDIGMASRCHRIGIRLMKNITVISDTWVMGLGERYDLSAAQEFTAGSFLVVPKKVPHFALCKGETIVQGHGLGPLDTTFIRPGDDPRKKTR